MFWTCIHGLVVMERLKVEVEVDLSRMQVDQQLAALFKKVKEIRNLKDFRVFLKFGLYHNLQNFADNNL